MLYYYGRLEVSTHASEETKATRWLLQTLFTNKLARTISWEGTKETKIALKPTKICKLMLCILKKTFSKSNLIMATGQIQRWFNTSSQRKVESSSGDSSDETTE
ncbi:uncharacterized protein LOC117646107 [Thrips palmi]|uniref:Uncharacterized protein LOC117646107 n=1 Tax=Thrips palmi TaxID=161013 RepID=A0A6P8YZG7_THRPL|nr:uncharacterized protein LOC117646107 [Thrips palmi]XP_034242707.1 uncharacterized protein LOC117646107 [Thrips palmi]